MKISIRKKNLFICLISFTVISTVFLGSCTQTSEPEQPEEPKLQEVSLNITYNGNISEIGEMDKYIFKPDKDYYIHFVCAESIEYSDFNPDIAVLNELGNELARGKDYSLAVVTNFLVGAGKTYEIQVREWSDDQTGGYVLKIQEDTDDEKLLIEGQQITGEIDYKKDSDEFILSIPNEAYYHIAVKEYVNFSEFNPHISLLDFVTKQLLTNDKSYTEAVIVNEYLGQNSQYLVKVQEWSDDEVGKYYIRYMKDPDDGKTLIEGQQITGEIEFAKDADEFILSITDEGYYHIAVREYTPNSEFNPHISLLDFATKYLLVSDKSYTEAVIVNEYLGQNTKFFVKVQEWSDDEVGKYIITYMKDPDDGVLLTQTPSYYEGIIDYAGDKDDLFFRSFSGGTFKIVLAEKIPNSDYNPLIRIYDQFNNLIESKASYDSSVVNNLNFEAGSTYKLNISKWGDDNPGEYVLRIESQ